MDIDQISQEERQRLNVALGKHGTNHGKRKAVRTTSDTMPELEHRNRRRDKCSFHRPCNLPECDYCGGGMPYRSNTKNDDIYQQRADPKQSRNKSKNYRSVAGRWLTEPFNGFPQSQCHPFTIDLFLERRDMNGIETTRRERAKFQEFIKQEMPDAVVRMICDISACLADNQYLFMPDTDIHPSFRNCNRPSEIAMNYHGHGIIWHPFLTSYQIAKKMRHFYPGNGRVCFSNPIPTTETHDGYLSGGLQGWGEYAGLEQTKVDLPFNDPNNDNVSAVRDMLLIRSSWPRSSRKITYGDKAQRVKELQLLSSMIVCPDTSSCDSYSDTFDVSDSDFYVSSPEYVPLITLITSPTPAYAQ
ncbi:MAG: hypothetical protein ABJ042_04860 [Lentilitoribacter sp.]